ncbi:MAG: methionine--tRNA ligase [Candidatus Peregrinibacteria bacterium]|nr:methionine--tRNA ligase [Candidatus Peregrinibacteria bacterium]
MPQRQYITTAIDYPNAPPHMGHVLEKVLADVSARWFRLRGDPVRFQIGTDEHGIKIQTTAKKENLTPKELVDRNVPLFRDLYAKLQISSDTFIRTSDQQVHWPTVIELWKRLMKAGALEKRTYSGLYCSGCERFVTAKDLVDGKCPDHNLVPQEVKEENWFFLLARESDWLTKLLAKSYHIVPSFRAQETLSLIEQGLEDVSFSRPKSSLSWGVPVPDDPNQVMYVWCDALTNYISGLGLLTDHAEGEWWDDAEVTHVIGKDIARFHALIWPAMLKHAKVRTPDRLLIHGFLTSEGQKMSKSLGNVVAPEEVLSKYHVDALRFYLSHEIPVGNDGDFSWKRFDELYNAKLRNQLGNLLNRVLVLLKRESAEMNRGNMKTELSKEVDVAWKGYAEAMNTFALHTGIQQAMTLVEHANVAMQTTAPWTMKGEEKMQVLSNFAEVLRHVSLLLLPFIPETAQKMSVQLGLPYADQMLAKDFVLTDAMKTWGGVTDWKTVGEPAILFPPLT